MKRPRRESLFLMLRPEELIARLATLVPPPRAHALRYHGVFAPNSRVRMAVVPAVEEAAPPVTRSPVSPRPAPSPGLLDGRGVGDDAEGELAVAPSPRFLNSMGPAPDLGST